MRNKRKIKNKLKKFLWKKFSAREYTYSYEGIEKIKTDLKEFFKEFNIKPFIEIPLDDIEVDKRKREVFIKGRSVDIFIKYLTKPKYIVTNFGELY